jgi:hypothetical protein
MIDNHRTWERWRWGHDNDKPPIFTDDERYSARSLLAESLLAQGLLAQSVLAQNRI